MSNTEPLVQSRQPILEDPAEGWNCGGGCFDIKRWFAGVITPDFNSDEARRRCGSLRRVDGPMASPLESSQELHLQEMRRNASELNAHSRVGGVPPRAQRWFGPMEAGSVRSASSALAASALGAGALAVPYAFSLTGVVLGLLTLAAVGLVSSLSLQILMVAARYTNTASYAAILELSVGKSWAATVLDLVVLGNGIGALICILIFEGDFLPPALSSIAGIEFSRTQAIFAVAVCVWPLTISANISALRYVTVCVPAVLLATIAIVLYDTPHFARETRSAGIRVEMWKFSPGTWLQAVAIFVNAFANHMNAVPVANALDNPSIARIVKCSLNGNMLVFALLAGLGLAGYLSWGDSIQGDFLLNYPEGRTEILCCRVLLAVIVFLVLPVALLPTAKSCAQLMGSMYGHQGKPHSFTHALSATLLLLVCTAVAVEVSDVAFVLGILGGVFAASLMYWFPSAVYRLLLWPTQPAIFRNPVMFLMVLLGTLSLVSVGLKYI